MFSSLGLLLILKYFICITLLVAVILAPAYVARVNSKSQYDMLLVHASSWLFGWTGVGWLFALYWAVKK